jgi:hypothetical protein
MWLTLIQFFPSDDPFCLSGTILGFYQQFFGSDNLFLLSFFRTSEIHGNNCSNANPRFVKVMLF